MQYAIELHHVHKNRKSSAVAKNPCNSADYQKFC